MVFKKRSNNVWYNKSGRAKINFCPLRLAEKLHHIELFNENRLLNKKNKFISGFRHQVKLLLKSFKRK